MSYIGRLVILLMLGFSLTALAAGNKAITGAFGLQLGDVYDTRSSYGKKSKQSDLPYYPFTPKKKFESFSRYAVSVTPITEKIFLINASAVFRDSRDCENELDLLSSVLAEKYGPPVKTRDRFDLNNTTVLIDQPENDRKIFLKCARLRSNVKLDISYSDTKLKSLAEQEYKTKEREKLDDFGL